jgi:hypothetical protein
MMKVGDAVFHKPFGNTIMDDPLMSHQIGLLLSWWEYPGDEERSDEIYWKVLMNGSVVNIKDRHLVLA